MLFRLFCCDNNRFCRYMIELFCMTTKLLVLCSLVVYATLVTLDGSHDGGTEQHQLVTVPTHDLNGQAIDLAALAGLSGHGNLTVSDLQVINVALSCQVMSMRAVHFTLLVVLLVDCWFIWRVT